MTNETSQNEKAQKEWADLQRDLDTLGEQLESLRDHSTALGGTLVADLEARFQEVRNRALGFHNAAESQVDELRKAALEQAAQTQTTLTETGMKSAEMAKDTARQVWERSQPFRMGAQEVGQGLARAWTEIAASFGKAAEKVQTERAKSATGEESQKPS
ncbi:MAG: hypothetical protein ACTSRM_09155 [Alphaproteobacteria bacterium]|jgi:hypothetical protein|uniref:hypothetical protein n=1 Tax=Methyloceanibacter sp. TaxID=1965321 RepID=UPI003561BCC4